MTLKFVFTILKAQKDGYSHDKAGLIPSKDFQEK